MKEKIDLTFLGLFDIPLLKYLIFKTFLACSGYFGLLIKIKKGFGTTIIYKIFETNSVFTQNSASREKFNFCFPRVFR